MSGVTNDVVTGSSVTGADVTFSRVEGPPGGIVPPVGDVYLLDDTNTDKYLLDDTNTDNLLLENA